MRIDIIYGFSVASGDLLPATAPRDNLLRYAPLNGADPMCLGGVVLATLIEDADLLDVTAFDAINGLIDDSSPAIATFDDWLANTPDGQALHALGDDAPPSVLIVSLAPGVVTG